MADFLIMAVNKSNRDPDKDAMSYKRGDIVEVFADGRLQVPASTSPFVLIRVPGVSKAQVDKYIAMHETYKKVKRKTLTSTWNKLKTAGDFGGFTALPKVINSGTSPRGDWVELQGDVLQPALRRKFRFRLDDLPLSVKKILHRDRWLRVTPLQAKQFMFNKITRLNEA